jgi:uncharacterized protein (TIGR03437 family)
MVTSLGALPLVFSGSLKQAVCGCARRPHGYVAMLAILLCAATAIAQAPAIGAAGVVNGASYAGPAASGVNVTIAEGSIVAIFGTNLGPATIVQALSTPLPTQLPNATGTSVNITAGGSSFACYMLYAVSGQVGCIVPSTVPVGTAMFAVTYNGQTSAAQAVTIVKQGFALFTKNQGGTGPVVAQNVQSNGSFTVNGLAGSAKEGQILTLYGTGLGPISGPDNTPPGAVNLASGVTVVIGGQTLTPQYAGRSPSFAGLDQINVQLPASFTSSGASVASIAGCFTPLAVSTGSGSSTTVAISLASGGGACPNPYGLSPTALATLDAGGTAVLGAFTAERVDVDGMFLDAVVGGFVQINANDLAAIAASGPQQTLAPPGTCAAFQGAGVYSTPQTNLHYLDAGPSLKLTGPGGVTQTLALQQVGDYAAGGSFTAPKFLTSGTWTVTGTGGNDIGAFTASLNITGPVTVTNGASFGQTVSRSTPLTINWTGGGPNDIVFIAGESTAVLVPSSVLQLVFDWSFDCYAPAAAGTFTVPTNILQTLPASPPNNLSFRRGDQRFVGKQHQLHSPVEKRRSDRRRHLPLQLELLQSFQLAIGAGSEHFQGACRVARSAEEAF